MDTVFVVSHYVEYDISDKNALAQEELGRYRDYVFKMAFPKPSDFSLKLRLYYGATYENQVNGMYSFVPAKQYHNEQTQGFPRIPLKDMDYITNNLNAAPRISEANDDDVKVLWNIVRELTTKHGCVEGLKFTVNGLEL